MSAPVAREPETGRSNVSNAKEATEADRSNVPFVREPVGSDATDVMRRRPALPQVEDRPCRKSVLNAKGPATDRFNVSSARAPEKAGHFNVASAKELAGNVATAAGERVSVDMQPARSFPKYVAEFLPQSLEDFRLGFSYGGGGHAEFLADFSCRHPFDRRHADESGPCSFFKIAPDDFQGTAIKHQSLRFFRIGIDTIFMRSDLQTLAEQFHAGIAQKLRLLLHLAKPIRDSGHRNAFQPSPKRLVRPFFLLELVDLSEGREKNVLKNILPVRSLQLRKLPTPTQHQKSEEFFQPFPSRTVLLLETNDQRRRRGIRRVGKIPVERTIVVRHDVAYLERIFC